MANERYFDVTYESGAVEKVKPLPRAKWADAMELQQSLLEEFLKASLMPGTLLSPANKRTWSLLEQMALLLPTISTEPLDLSQMDTDEIIEVFFTATTNRDEEGAIVPEEKNDNHLPSKIARLHGFAFFLFNEQGLIQLARGKFISEIQKKQKALKSKIEETPTQTP